MLTDLIYIEGFELDDVDGGPSEGVPTPSAKSKINIIEFTYRWQGGYGALTGQGEVKRNKKRKYAPLVSCGRACISSLHAWVELPRYLVCLLFLQIKALKERGWDAQLHVLVCGMYGAEQMPLAFTPPEPHAPYEVDVNIPAVPRGLLHSL